MKILTICALSLLAMSGTRAHAESVVVEIAFDAYPADISFQILRDGEYVEFDADASAEEGDRVALGWGGFSNELADQTLMYVWDLALGDYEFVISDSYGDGLCCNEGSGGYSISVNDELIYDASGTFGAGETYAFTVTLADGDADGVGDEVDNCTQVANAEQIDSDGDGYGNACDADLNNDCSVNVVDLGIFRSRFFSTDADADFNGDGTVNVVDLGLLRSMFFSTPGPSSQQDLCSLPVVVNAPISLRGTWSYDLDTGAEGVLSQMEMDFFFQRATATVSSFNPINGATLAMVGSTRPSPAGCAAAQMTAAGVDSAVISVGDWFCLSTNDGRLSRFEVTGFNGSSINASSRIDIELTTWE